MARPRIDIGPDGLVRPSDDAKDRLRRRYGPFELALDLPGVVVLRGESHARLQMAGEILNRMSVMEIINIVATSHWRGDLHVVSSEATRVLVFDQGALKGARSDAPVDRLGEVLFRGGFLDRAQLKTLVKETGEKRLGELAVERGYLDAGQLYQALQRQAEETFFNALLMADGFYAFLVDDDDEDPASTTVHLSVQGLLMEGVQRIDEMALFQERVPSTALCPKPVPDAPPPKKLDDAATRLLAMCDGDRSIDELGRLTGLGEFGATKAVYQLIQQKLVTLHAARRVDPQRVVALVARFNEILQDIFLAVATYGGLAQTRATLDAWIQGSGYGPYFGEGVDDFGAIDGEFVAKALEGVEMDAPLEALHQALHELAAFALFSATTALPRDQELSLARDVNARLKAIRIE
ncbi:MAG: DUF4388 domain-containing protein [Sandaracinus sp.]|nr:DUF4388 domain-containing protein [Sandaracinus sp.]MCB9614944.1 DUF4388 domain-containing protein [Sandaracinus sp.]MCB9625457.1 DUF4388 domain-containing protein [Sandaracinus sp.]MCB9630580.1 DUF4388 domain-containing protein [Sandaracinus sp.]MCB9637004.1 DUF4388 domain-containing protein [Sandaracinus sp.]